MLMNNNTNAKLLFTLLRQIVSQSATVKVLNFYFFNESKQITVNNECNNTDYLERNING